MDQIPVHSEEVDIFDFQIREWFLNKARSLNYKRTGGSSLVSLLELLKGHGKDYILEVYCTSGSMPLYYIKKASDDTLDWIGHIY